MFVCLYRSASDYFRYNFFFFKQKTVYEMRIIDWSSDVCSTDLRALAFELGGEIVWQAAGEMQHGLGRRLVACGDQLGGAGPVNLHDGIEIGLRARHLEQPGGAEMRTLAEDLFVGVEDDRGAAAVRRRADLFQLGLRCAARIMLAPQLAVAGDQIGRAHV